MMMLRSRHCVRSLSMCLLMIIIVAAMESPIDMLCPPTQCQAEHQTPPPLIAREHRLVWLSGKKTSHNSSVGS